MSGKSCIVSMHAASAVSDMQQQHKRLVTTKGATTTAANSGGPPPINATTSAVGVQSANSISPPSLSAPDSAATPSTALPQVALVPGGGGIKGVSVRDVNGINPDTTAGNSNGAKHSNRDSVFKLPLPPPGTGIRHNVQPSADISTPSNGIPRGAPIPLPAPGTGIRHNVQASADISTPSDGLPRGAAAYAARNIGATSSKTVAAPVTTNKSDTNKQQHTKRRLAQPGTKREEGRGEDDGDSFSGSSDSDDDSNSDSSNSDDSDATSDLDDSNSSFSSAACSPLHDQMEAETENMSPDLEYAVIAHRKKGLLLSRLSEMSVRGTLVVIDLARRGLRINDVALIEQVILGNPKLSVLKLSYNDLGDVGANCIANALCTEANGTLEHRSLAVLDLSFNGIGDDGCGGLAMKAIAGNYNLRALFLTGNDVGEKGAISIAGALVHGCYLSHLHLTANKIGPEGTKALATAIAEVDARIQMQQQVVPQVQITGDIANLFSRRMEHLFLGSSSMESSGFYSVSSMLLSNASLKILCLNDNNIDDRDMAILAQAFTQNKSVPLESLMLSHNQITCAGVESLMNSIWGSPTLHELTLDNNKMQDRGAQLCAVVLTSVTLRKLDVSFNAVTTVGIRALMKSLSEDTNMRSLGICGIPIDLNAAKAVSFALAYNTGLETVYMDSCQVGYSAQRHITAGIVSNQRAPLQQLTGFPLGPITVTLGMPQVPDDWSNEKVLAFVRLMWRNWGRKRGPSPDGETDEVKGPAPPAAVAAAAKIALASLGSNPSAELDVEPRKSETHNDIESFCEISPMIPPNAALIERDFSGRWSVAVASNAEGEQVGFLQAWTESSAFGRPSILNYSVSGYHEAPLDNPEQRNRNLRWLRTHFRPLIDVGKLPFNNADMWQLHQYYFSPPYYGVGDNHSKPSASINDQEATKSGAVALSNTSKRAAKDRVVAPPSTPDSSSPSTLASMGKTISFQALSTAVAAAHLTNGSNNKRSVEGEDGTEVDTKLSEDTEPSAKRNKSMKPRIAYYPRIRARLESLGTKPLEQTLSLLRKLKYVENVIFPEHTVYEDLDRLRESEHATRLDVEMILLDLI